MARTLDVQKLFLEVGGLLTNPNEDQFNDEANVTLTNDNCENTLTNSVTRCKSPKKIYKETNWNNIRKSASKSASIATKVAFDKILQLHAAFQRDIILMVHYKDSEGDQIRYWGSPGLGQQFLNSEPGEEMAQSWESLSKSTDQVDRRGGNDGSTFGMTESYNKSNRRSNPIHASQESMVEDNVVGNSFKYSNKKLTRQCASAIQSPKRLKQSTSRSSKRLATTTSSAHCPLCNPDNIYVVESIISKRQKQNGQNEYHVKWLGWSDEFNSWEPEENIIDKDLVATFNQIETEMKKNMVTHSDFSSDQDDGKRSYYL